MLSDLGKLETRVGNYKDSYARMKDREEASLRASMDQIPSKMTRGQLDQNRRADMVANNTQKFANASFGIHGNELPMFSDTRESKTWWQLQKDKKKNENPMVQSAALLKQNQKFWAKNDLTLIADHTKDSAPKDPLKTSMYRKMAELEGPPKITTVVHCPDEVLLKDPDVKLGHKHKLVWSTVEHNNRCFGDDRVFDKIIA